jgi:hypothetical protein
MHELRPKNWISRGTDCYNAGMSELQEYERRGSLAKWVAFAFALPVVYFLSAPAMISLAFHTGNPIIATLCVMYGPIEMLLDHVHAPEWYVQYLRWWGL